MSVVFCPKALHRAFFRLFRGVFALAEFIPRDDIIGNFCLAAQLNDEGVVFVFGSQLLEQVFVVAIANSVRNEDYLGGC